MHERACAIILYCPFMISFSVDYKSLGNNAGANISRQWIKWCLEVEEDLAGVGYNVN